jgi:hypothetical protein
MENIAYRLFIYKVEDGQAVIHDIFEREFTEIYTKAGKLCADPQFLIDKQFEALDDGFEVKLVKRNEDGDWPDLIELRSFSD